MAEKTATFPIQESLESDTQALAKKLNISWSQLVTLALNDFVRRNQSKQRLVERINLAHTDAPDEEEKRLQQHRRSSHRKLVEGEW